MPDDVVDNKLHYVTTIGEKGIHYPYRVCSNCGGNVEGIPSACPHCGVEIHGYIDRYVRKKYVYFVGSERHETLLSK